MWPTADRVFRATSCRSTYVTLSSNFSLLNLPLLFLWRSYRTLYALPPKNGWRQSDESLMPCQAEWPLQPPSLWFVFLLWFVFGLFYVTDRSKYGTLLHSMSRAQPYDVNKPLVTMLVTLVTRTKLINLDIFAVRNHTRDAPKGSRRFGCRRLSSVLSKYVLLDSGLYLAGFLTVSNCSNFWFWSHTSRSCKHCMSLTQNNHSHSKSKSITVEWTPYK